MSRTTRIILANKAGGALNLLEGVLQFHAQRGVVLAVLCASQEPKHLWLGVEGRAVAYLWVLHQEMTTMVVAILKAVRKELAG